MHAGLVVCCASSRGRFHAVGPANQSQPRSVSARGNARHASQAGPSSLSFTHGFDDGRGPLAAPAELPSDTARAQSPAVAARVADDLCERVADAIEASAALSDSPEEHGWLPHVDEHSRFFEWKFNSRIHYVQQGSDGPPVLMVHGFGVGSYQFRDNMDELSRDHRVWAMDLLGQGCSWPSQRTQSSDQLRYSLDTWTDQLAYFVREVVREPVYVAGNSLGGLLAVALACHHPDLVRGVVLLNAAPFWSVLPRRDTLLGRLLPYDGTVPAPEPLKRVIQRYWFSNLSSPDTIRDLIRLVYNDASMIDAAFLDRIVASARHPEALEAFASIIFSPGSQLSFNEMISRIQAPICLIYGREDPWIVPMWGQRLKRHAPSVQYYELSPAGHCPHHEAPVTVNTVMRGWIGAQGRQVAGGKAEECGAAPASELLALGESLTCTETDGRSICATHTAGLPRNVFEHLDHAAWRARRFLSSWLRRRS